ncbi:UDP-2,4-diacetamido-2,4,6-trideoxy-beta-L-altropyranose hydrolase [Pigmentiphaga sp. NML030171]|uniref:UDP-2,4-diacetamido-2,4, 6-trideoxy-beta-L-altropyranose hydrolase n=1 Tax=Pigmentiphaga sp. NML030171 TaxID=2008676 RepID=UPI000B417C0C|nr:UDP-2,4-diacetamido-2,4,6-trideoxy-beta-L-altropyranose hydrolase [Pigmentiphaga sp. NML030171]OVZ59871.1 UDP-2,4-diacetamido-2,4,6-trideoxy-beta-L-altropyranose hydrolase [Pigmentiphaga sp. NML030171]
MQTIAFRADASLNIGTGHVMRCLTLADALRDEGYSSLFICREHPGNLIDIIRQRGYEAVALPYQGTVTAVPSSVPSPIHAAWLGSDWETDAQQTQAALANVNTSWLVVDHYSLDSRWENRFRTSIPHLLVIDDLADRSHDCDLLLDQNLGRRWEDYSAHVPPGCVVLTGPDYVLLRPEFHLARSFGLRRRTQPDFKHLLITMGGIDKGNVTAEVLSALRLCPLPSDARITIVMGSRSPWLEAVRQAATELPWHTEVKVDVNNMAELMANSDLAIGAAGSTAWERCCVGLPSIMVVLADNQLIIAQMLSHAGGAFTIESAAAIAIKLPDILTQLVNDAALRQATAAAASRIVDGEGVRRVIQAMENT